jgi:hypothetical protein
VKDASGQGLAGFSSTLSFQTNTWVHIAWTMNGSTSSFYVNGSAYGLTDGMTSPSGVMRKYCFIGHPADLAPPIGTGGYDDIKIYGRALNSTEILDDMNLPPVFNL